MLQRIQSLFLFGAALLTLLFIFLPVAFVEVNSIKSSITPFIVLSFPDIQLDDYSSFPGWISIIAATMGITLSFITIFRYNYRLLQITYGKVNIFIHIVAIISAFWFLQQFKGIDGAIFKYGYAAIFPLISIILIFLANKAIRKDENLVRSADRIR